MHRILVGCCLLPLSLGAQDLDCRDGRYTDHVFSEVNVVKDLQYGEAITMAGKSQILLLDFYEPVGDLLEERPLVIMAHGGAFVDGDRTQTEEFCFDFAKRGYVVANMEYRLLDKLVLDSTGLTEVAFMASNDMRAAVRYFKENASNSNTYGISLDHLFVAGISAGGIMASHVAFLDTTDQIPEYIQLIIEKHGGFEGNSSENTHISSEVNGVLSYSGALTRGHWIDNNDPPVYFAHDDQDQIVPCSYSTISLSPLPVYLYGSCAMKTVADQMGVRNEFHLVANSTEHVSYFRNDTDIQIVLDESADFLRSLICQGSTRVPEEFAGHSSEISIYPNPFRDVLNIRSKEKIQEITVTGISGQVCLHTDNYSGNSLDMSEYPDGIYLVRIQTAKSVQILKAIKE